MLFTRQIYVLYLGPEAGVYGVEIVAQGTTLQNIMGCERFPTGQYLTDKTKN